MQILKGEAPGKVLPLQTGRTVIGRHPTCHVVLDNAAVSRHHAQILESHGLYFLEDLRSRNGTFLNGEPLSSRAELCDGDQIRICDVIMSFQIDGTATPGIWASKSQPMGGIARTVSESEIPPEGVRPFDESHVYVLPEPFSEPAFDSPSAVIKKLDSKVGSSTDFKSGVKPEVKLKAIVELT
ncbi:MAG TPA: FHA domain-containing protein, partial [Caulifigura sp.]|nr:FHA domain-containing protein [Caulifigura sp.]